MTAVRIAQYTGHVVGSALCVWLLARYGRERWLADAAAEVEPYPVSSRSTMVVSGALAGGVVVGVAWVVADPVARAVAVLRVAATGFTALVCGCALLGRRRALV